MADVQNTQTAAPASIASASAAASATLGAQIDAEIVLVKSRLALLESAGKTDWAKVKAWVVANWPHAVTWASLAASSPTIVDIAKKFL